MTDVDDVQDGKNYHIGVPMQANVFFLKGSNSLDWCRNGRNFGSMNLRLNG